MINSCSREGFELIYCCAGIKEATGFDRVELLLVDLSSFDSVKAFADRFDQEVERLDILVNNAAVSLPKYEDTKDGWEQK